MESYTIKTNAFEGPFALLLDLIEKHKMHISDVSLAEVTEDYLNYVNREGALLPGQISGFIVVASTLILIKSKSLLPSLQLTSDEEGDIRNLEERLRLYELFTRLGKNVSAQFGQEIIFAPLERKNKNIVFLPDDKITKESMMGFARDVLGSVPKKIALPKVEVKKVISIEEMLDKLTDRIKNTMEMSFKEFTGHGSGSKAEKVVAIVGFLAMLELVRQGAINATQEEGAEDIILEKVKG